MTDTHVREAGERRGARKAPKRQRPREDGRQPANTHAAEPPQSGRLLRAGHLERREGHLRPSDSSPDHHRRRRNE